MKIQSASASQPFGFGWKRSSIANQGYSQDGATSAAGQTPSGHALPAKWSCPSGSKRSVPKLLRVSYSWEGPERTSSMRSSPRQMPLLRSNVGVYSESMAPSRSLTLNRTVGRWPGFMSSIETTSIVSGE